MALREEELNNLSDDVDLDRDRALVERCQAGNSAAFGILYARYYERLLRFCLRRLHDRHEAEDATQEAFARAWKALPRFAGERRFYPWLTVIAGNICTDVMRRRSRSTPTDDLALTAQHAVGGVCEETSEERILAAVDGELVHRALNRLSTRHRDVLAMREGSGWSYQQIADHEGVEIGTIETLLWRARQALKREFAVVSESKEALAGFLVATGALIRRTVFRAAHRGATVQHNNSGGGAGVMRNAMAGVAVTGAAVAAAFIAPHALTTSPSGAASASGSPLAAPPFVVGSTHLGGPSSGGSAGVQDLSPGGLHNGAPTGVTGGSSGGIGAPTSVRATLGSGSSLGAAGSAGGLNQAAGGLPNSVKDASGGVGQTIGGVASGVGQTVGGVGQTVGGVVGAVTSAVSGLTSGVTGATNGVSGVANSVDGVTQSIGLGDVLPGTSGSGTSGSGPSSSTTSTTPTTSTNPVQSILGGTTKTVGGLLGG